MHDAGGHFPGGRLRRDEHGTALPQVWTSTVCGRGNRRIVDRARDHLRSNTMAITARKLTYTCACIVLFVMLVQACGEDPVGGDPACTCVLVDHPDSFFGKVHET